jgi:hypothetical protein
MINQIIIFVSLFVVVDSAYAAGMTIALAVGLTGAYATVAAIAINIGLSYVVSQILAPNFGAQQQPADQGVRVQVPPDTTTTVPMVYGVASIGGKFVDACLRTDQRVMYYVMAISCKSEDSIVVADTTQMYYGDRKIAFDPTFPTRVVSLTDTAGNVDTKIYDQLFINLYASDKDGNVTSLNGAPMPWQYQALPGNPDPASLMMDALSGLPAGQQWTSTGRRMNGLVWAVIRLSYSREAETTALQPITFYIGQFMKATATTKAGDVWADYMTNPIYGAGLSVNDIDLNSANALNAYSDELITYNDYFSVPKTQPRYRINGVVDASKGILENVDQILIACDSWMQYNAVTGKWAVVINKAEASSYAFNDSNIIGSIVVGTIDITQMPNQIQGKFPDKNNRDQYNYVNLKTPNNLLYPNEPVNKINLNYYLVNDSVQALYLANRTLEQAREDLLVTINTTYDGIQVDAGDVVSVTNTAYGWNNKLFRAMQVKEVADSSGLTAQIQLVEYNAAVYDNFDITQYTPAGNSDMPSAGYFSALSPPAVVDSFPYEATPTFDINVAIPITGRVTLVTLFYTTSTTPTAADWQVLDTQSLSDSAPFVNGSVLTFTDYNLAPASYYFAYKVSNDVASSILSPLSILFNWNPDPANATSFVLTLNPATLQVPYNGATPTLTGINFRLYGANGLGPVQYVTSATDSDAAFVAGTWRIGGTSTTGTGDIVQTGITFPLPPTDAGTFAQFGTATAMSASPATVLIPVRYKDLGGTVRQVSPATLQAVYSIQGESGYQHNTAYLYQWSPTAPTNPSGTSVFTWSTGLSSSYTGAGGWDVGIPVNPNIPSIKLWRAAKGVNDVATATTTIVSWASGYSVSDITQNGADGVQTATPTVFQWAVTIPSPPTGTSTYTWATSNFTPIPSGWYAQPPTPVAGNTLWGASVSLTESASAITSTINWTTASISARGFSGETGASARICYTKTTLSALASSPATITTSGSGSFPPNDSWGSGTVWQATPPAIVAGESVYQSDGIFSPTTGNTVWNVPYISALKVGSLSAITANMGSLTSGTITGALIRTAASGQRVEMDYASNYLSAYNSSGALVTQIGGIYGNVFVSTSFSFAPAGGFYQNSSGAPAVYCSNSGDALQGVSSSSGTGVVGTGVNTGGPNHGVRGQNLAQNGGTSTSGIVGVANGFDFYADGAGTNYGPFTGAHDILTVVQANIPVGYIVCDVKLVFAKNISNTIFEVAMSSSANQVPVGVMVLNNGLLANSQPAAFIEKFEYTEVDDMLVTTTIMSPAYDVNKNLYNYCVANAVGEGQVYVCGESGNIAKGDLIVTSSTAGVGMKQSDNIVRSITVAKAREAVTFTDTTTPVLVACIYLCG